MITTAEQTTITVDAQTDAAALLGKTYLVSYMCRGEQYVRQITFTGRAPFHSAIHGSYIASTVVMGGKETAFALEYGSVLRLESTEPRHTVKVAWTYEDEDGETCRASETVDPASLRAVQLLGAIEGAHTLHPGTITGTPGAIAALDAMIRRSDARYLDTWRDRWTVA